MFLTAITSFNSVMMLILILIFINTFIVNISATDNAKVEGDCEDASKNCAALDSFCYLSDFQPFLKVNCRKTCGYCTIKPKSEWSSWTNVTACSVTCGGGFIKQKRNCQNSKNCPGKKKRKIPCNDHNCEMQWSVWTHWSGCSASCGRGTQTRNRICFSNNECQGGNFEEKSCLASIVCPCTCIDDPNCFDAIPTVCSMYVTNDVCNQNQAITSTCRKKCGLCGKCECGTWSMWETGGCSQTCGPGIRYRRRTCPAGHTCHGVALITETCSLGDCPELTDWSKWGHWSRCSVSCGNGIETRTRECRGACEGISRQVKSCVKKTCPVPLGEWSQCSRSCDWGTKKKRKCRFCPVEYQDCKVSDCKVEKCIAPFYPRYKVRAYSCCNASGSTAKSCGISPVASGRIIGGNAVSRGVWPWMVQVEVGNKKFCGGTLISDRLVITAAHCFRSRVYRSVFLRFGAMFVQERSIHIQTRVAHPQNVSIHSGTYLENDIAIVKLTEPVIIGGDYVRPLCLPRGESIPEDTACVAAGWGTVTGTNGDSTLSITLQDVVLRILPFELCKKAYYLDLTDEQKMICAGRVGGGVDTCRGDSGGPLMCQRCSNCAWFLAGVTSFGNRVCGSSYSPAIYTKISAFESWINSIAKFDINAGSFTACLN